MAEQKIGDLVNRSRAEVQLPPRRYLLKSDGEIVMVLDDRRWLGDCISSRVTDIQLVITP